MPEYNPYELPGDARNPYAAPRADLAREQQMYVKGGFEPYSIGAAWNLAMDRFKEQSGLVIGLVIGGNILSFVLQIVLNVGTAPTFPNQNAPGPGLDVILVGAVVLLLIALAAVWLSLGQTIGLIKIARGQPASIGDLFSGGRYIIGFILASILYTICVYGVILALMIPFGILAYFVGKGMQDTATIIIVVAGIILAVGVVIFVSVRFYFYEFAIVDRRRGFFEGVVDSFSTSYRITQGRTLSVLGLMIACSLIAAAGVLACGVGVIITGPFAALMLACGYVLLANEDQVASFGDTGGELVDL
jgi:hypothetical protein